MQICLSLSEALRFDLGKAGLPLKEFSDSDCMGAKPLNNPRWRRALWIALGINAGFFLTEFIAGATAGSSALRAARLRPRGAKGAGAIGRGIKRRASGAREAD
jgi:hypothetical protein